MTTKSINTREIVLDLLMEWEKGTVFSHRLIRDVLNKYDYLSGQEKSFIKRLSEGTIERRIELDYLLDQISSVPVAKMKPLIRTLLRMSVYQIFYMDGVPHAAAVSEAVKLAEKRKFHSLKGFVNGVLRNAARKKDSMVYPEKDPVMALSVRYSMPSWLVEMWLEDYGREQTEQMLKGLLGQRPVTLRFDSPEKLREWMARMEGSEIALRVHPYLDYAVEVEGAEGVASLPGYPEGLFAVQDVSSMLAVEAAGIRPGDFVLDVCAAPGGKTGFAAKKALPGGQVEAWDISESKVFQMQENLERMGLGNVRTRVKDASVEEPGLTGRADVVLADVPCSGLGVIGRKKDVKYRMTPRQLTDLVKLQQSIVRQAVTYVKDGGVLLYSTCTINTRENQDMVRWICESFSFQVEEMRQLLPGIDDSDGFFFARLRKMSGK